MTERLTDADLDRISIARLPTVACNEKLMGVATTMEPTRATCQRCLALVAHGDWPGKGKPARKGPLAQAMENLNIEEAAISALEQARQRYGLTEEEMGQAYRERKRRRQN